MNNISTDLIKTLFLKIKSAPEIANEDAKSYVIRIAAKLNYADKLLKSTGTNLLTPGSCMVTP